MPLDETDGLVAPLSELLSDLLVRLVVSAVPKLSNGVFPLDWGKILSVDILQQRFQKRFIWLEVLDDCRHLVNSCDLVRTPPPLARDDFIEFSRLPHHYWLDEPMFLDGGGKLLEAVFLERLPRLVGIRSNKLCRDAV